MPERLLLGPAIAAARVGAGLSEAEFADRLGVSTRRLWRWEHGTEFVDASTFARISETLGLLEVELRQLADLLAKAAERRSNPRPTSALSPLVKPDGTPRTTAEQREHAAELLAEAVTILELAQPERNS